MTGMEHAIEQAVEVLDAVDRNHDLDSGDLASSEEYARALADAGLLAPAPLREEWAAIDDDGHVLMRYGADSHSPHREYGTSLTYSRWASDWKPWEDDR